MSRRGVLLGLSALAALLSVVLRLRLFPDGSLNNDEIVYLLQGRALADGRLLLPAPAPVEAYQPWFFAPVPGGFAGKYLPVVPALYAAGLVLAGSVVPVLAALAAAVPLLTERLARVAGLAPAAALVAAALVTLSPAVLVQTGLTLSYLPFLVLLLLGWTLLLRLAQGAPVGRTGVAAGAVASAAACARPLDAVLLLAAPALLALLRLPAAGRARAVAGAVAGALPLAAVVLLYDARVTGSPTRLPFSLLESRDRLGFGGRKLFPEDRLHPFGVAESLQGAGLHFVAQPATWFALAPLLAVLAVLALRRWRSLSEGLRALVVSAGLLLAAYLFFWGPYNASVLWGGPRVVGPMYAVPLLVPLALLAAPGLHRLLRRRGAVLLLVVAALPALLQTGRTWSQAGTDAARTAAVLAVADAARRTGPLLVDVDPPYLGHPVNGLVNLPGQRRAPVLLASQTPPAQVRVPTRLLQLPEDLYAPGGRFSYVLREQLPVSAPVVRVEVARAGGDADELLVVERAGRTVACRLGAARVVALAPTTWSSDCGGAPVPADWGTEPYRQCPDQDCLALATYRRAGGGRWVRTVWRQVPLSVTADGVATLLDGEPLRRRGGGWISVEPG